MPCNFSDNSTWTLIAGAVLLAAVLAKGRSQEEIGQLAAFFTALGDILALFALGAVAQSELNSGQL